MGRATYNNSFLVQEKHRNLFTPFIYIIIIKLIHICTPNFQKKIQQMLKIAEATGLKKWGHVKERQKTQKFRE